VKPHFIVFVGSPEKERRILENDRCRSLHKIRLNDGSRKTIHPGMIDRDSTVFPTIFLTHEPQNKDYCSSLIDKLGLDTRASEMWML
jgi:hypothetical protein